MSTPEDDMLAAELALGTLPRSERVAASARRATDGAFDRTATEWEARLGPLSDADLDVQAPETVWAAIVAEIERLRGAAGRDAATAGAVVLQMRRRVAFWRGAAALSSAIAACLVVWVAVGEITRTRSDGIAFVAVLQTSDQAPAFLMQAGLRGDDIAVRGISAPAVPGKSYELWMIDASLPAPKALGLIDATGSSRPVLPRVSADVLTRATYAVTVEAPGGSASGAPTSTPVFFGHLLRTNP